MQSKKESLIESLNNILIGFGIMCFCNWAILPYFINDGNFSGSDVMAFGAIMTFISCARSYTLRRLYNAGFLTKLVEFFKFSRNNHLTILFARRQYDGN